MSTTLRIPEGLAFEALRLARDPVTHDVTVDESVVARIWIASGLDPAAVGEDALAALIVAWYTAHRQAGGTADPVAEQILAEIHAEHLIGAWRVQSAPGPQ